MKKVIVSGVFGLALAAAALPESNANAETFTYLPGLTLNTPISIECANPGSSQDVAKTPVLKNSAGAPISKGTTLFWQSSDGDKGSLKLDADLAPGATIKAMGSAGNAYTCVGSFTAWPDLTIKTANWSSKTAVAIDLANLDGFAGAGSSVVRLEVVSCSGQVLQTVYSPAVSLAKGESKVLTLAASYPSVRSYLRVTADANKSIVERSEANNVLDTMNSCVR